MLCGSTPAEASARCTRSDSASSPATATRSNPSRCRASIWCATTARLATRASAGGVFRNGQRRGGVGLPSSTTAVVPTLNNKDDARPTPLPLCRWYRSTGFELGAGPQAVQQRSVCPRTDDVGEAERRLLVEGP